MGTAVHDGVLALSVQPAGKDVTAGLEGRVAVVALPVDQLDATSTDPLGTQFAFNPVQVQFHYATCAKLFNYPDAEGADGQKLAPEVAAGFPTVTDAGRTYTFRIHSGFGFSPPSHEQVTAGSFRHALERYLSPAGGNYDPLRRARRHRRRGGVHRRGGASRVRHLGARRHARHPAAPPGR